MDLQLVRASESSKKRGIIKPFLYVFSILNLVLPIGVVDTNVEIICEIIVGDIALKSDVAYIIVPESKLLDGFYPHLR